jgi:hypothetical protein
MGKEEEQKEGEEEREDEEEERSLDGGMTEWLRSRWRQRKNAEGPPPLTPSTSSSFFAPASCEETRRDQPNPYCCGRPWKLYYVRWRNNGEQARVSRAGEIETNGEK